MHDLIEKYLESGFGILGQEKKYNFLNKFGPKKCPGQHVARNDVKNLYSWKDFAPVEYFNHHLKTRTENQNVE